jgi:Fe(3+) dicitrate transport protein
MNNLSWTYFIIIWTFTSNYSIAQHVREDTIKYTGEEIQIKALKDWVRPMQKLKDIHGAFIMSGKKSEVIDLSVLHGNISEKTGRQIFAKVPGAFIYDMDGSGNQMNFSTRGLDPHRSWEYNIRQNGIITNTDMYGYPASHYNQPMESIKNIEIVRGTAALQYGAQFGGMINYITKTAPQSKKFEFESINSVGSYGLLSSYNAAGGNIGKLSYYAYFHRRVSDGYRKNGRSDANSQYLNLNYQFTGDISLKATLARSVYQYQLPGPLTDAMFAENPRQSTRFRNHYSPEIFIPSFSFSWNISENTFLEATSSAILGNRNSVLFIGFANKPDTINSQTGKHANRQVDIDNYNSFYNEIRLRQKYSIGNLNNAVAIGLCYINNDTRRRQLGKGSSGSVYDLSVEGPFGRDLHFRTANIALYAEHLTQITSKWSITPGLRYERGNTVMDGAIFNIPETVNQKITRGFLLAGISSQYQINEQNKIYAGFAQSYRPVIFADLIPIDALNRTDPNLKDASGYNLDFGISGNIRNRLYYDISVFVLQYNNRIGNQLLNENNTAFLFKTNTGNTLTKGLEMYIEGILLRTVDSKLSIYTSTSVMDGIYQKGNIIFSNQNTDISGNRPESLPALISRNGISAQYKSVSGALQFSYVSDSFADPANTIEPTPNGAAGIVPSYGLWDLNMGLIASEWLNFRVGVNNLLNRQYFTKRPTTYPGGGVWPSDGRSIVCTIGVKL